MQLDSVKLEDPRELLPNFTVQLWCELERRLTARIQEDLNTSSLGIALRQRLYDRGLAHELVARIYHTQLKEAQFVISFSTSVLKFNEAQIAAKNRAAREFAGEKLEKLAAAFGSEKKTLA